MTTMTRETSIRCGSCRNRHATVAGVQACYAGRHPAAEAVERVYSAEDRQRGRDQGRRGSAWDEKPQPDVPAGHYAVESLTGNNDLDFFSVDKGKGRWVGRTFVERVIGGRPSVAVRGVQAHRALEAIAAAGPDKAMARYGQEIGQCGKCNRHLTDELSRSLGIGPVCRDK
jgi:hypothetical protein